MDPTTAEHRSPSRILVAALRGWLGPQDIADGVTAAMADDPAHAAPRGQFVAKRMNAVECG